jgi:glyoxylase-like metal-dependent hydrolase (beta-lactamase superfamily II)
LREVETGVWHWEAPHPDWKSGEGWGQVVSSYAIDDGDRLLLFDPLAPPSEIEELAAERERMEPNDLVLWVESRRALVAGDTLIDRGNGLEFPVDWASKGVPPEQILEALRPLLELPVELVLATHGGPADRAALERALS